MSKEGVVIVMVMREGGGGGTLICRYVCTYILHIHFEYVEVKYA